MGALFSPTNLSPTNIFMVIFSKLVPRINRGVSMSGSGFHSVSWRYSADFRQPRLSLAPPIQMSNSHFTKKKISRSPLVGLLLIFFLIFGTRIILSRCSGSATQFRYTVLRWTLDYYVTRKSKLSYINLFF